MMYDLNKVKMVHNQIFKSIIKSFINIFCLFVTFLITNYGNNLFVPIEEILKDNSLQNHSDLSGVA